MRNIKNGIVGILIITGSNFLSGCGVDSDSASSSGDDASSFVGSYVLVSSGQCDETAVELGMRDTISTAVLKITSSAASQKYHMSDNCDIFVEADILSHSSSSLALQETAIRSVGIGCQSFGLKDGESTTSDRKYSLRLRSLEKYLFVTEPVELGGQCVVWKASK